MELQLHVPLRPTPKLLMLLQTLLVLARKARRPTSRPQMEILSPIRPQNRQQQRLTLAAQQHWWLKKEWRSLMLLQLLQLLLLQLLLPSH